MLHQIHKLFVGMTKRRRVHRAPSATSLNRHFERLESRAMLSASTGLPQFEIGEYGGEAHGYAELPLEDSAIYAPPRTATVDGAMQPDHEVGYSHVDIFHQSPALSNLGDGPGAWSYGSAPSVSIYVQPVLYAAATSSATSVAVSPTATVYFIFVKSSPFTFDSDSVSSTPPAPPQIARATAPSPGSTLPTSKPAGDPTANAPVFSRSSAPASSVPLTASATFAIPTAAQILARDSERGSFFSTSAADAVFQAYSPQLLLMASSTNSAKSVAESVSEDGSIGDASFDGFIQLGDLSSVQDAYVPSDVVARERMEVDAILQSLQDLEPMPSGFDRPNGHTDTRDTADASASDTPLPLALARIALADAEGGMVMLELNDTSSCDIDIANIAGSGAALHTIRSGVEANVGFYQAIDIGGGEPTAEIQPVGKAAPNPTRQTRPENRYSNDEGNGTSRKSAAAVGVSTLVGAMVWAAQRKQNSGENAELESTSRRTRAARG